MRITTSVSIKNYRNGGKGLVVRLAAKPTKPNTIQRPYEHKHRHGRKKITDSEYQERLSSWELVLFL